MNGMKRILLLTLLSCVGLCTQILSVFAQQGEKSVGINVGYGTASSFESFRLGAEFNWNATDHIRLSPSFDCYFASNAFSALKSLLGEYRLQRGLLCG